MGGVSLTTDDSHRSHVCRHHTSEELGQQPAERNSRCDAVLGGSGLYIFFSCVCVCPRARAFELVVFVRNFDVVPSLICQCSDWLKGRLV